MFQPIILLVPQYVCLKASGHSEYYVYLYPAVCEAPGHQLIAVLQFQPCQGEIPQAVQVPIIQIGQMQAGDGQSLQCFWPFPGVITVQLGEILGAKAKAKACQRQAPEVIQVCI